MDLQVESTIALATPASTCSPWQHRPHGLGRAGQRRACGTFHRLAVAPRLHCAAGEHLQRRHPRHPVGAPPYKAHPAPIAKFCAAAFDWRTARATSAGHRRRQAQGAFCQAARLWREEPPRRRAARGCARRRRLDEAAAKRGRLALQRLALAEHDARWRSSSRRAAPCTSSAAMACFCRRASRRAACARRRSSGVTSRRLPILARMTMRRPYVAANRSALGAPRLWASRLHLVTSSASTGAASCRSRLRVRRRDRFAKSFKAQASVWAQCGGAAQGAARRLERTASSRFFSLNASLPFSLADPAAATSLASCLFFSLCARCRRPLPLPNSLRRLDKDSLAADSWWRRADDGR